MNQIITEFIKEKPCACKYPRILGVDAGAGKDILAIKQLYEDTGMTTVSDALLKRQRYEARLKSMCENVFVGDIDEGLKYDYITIGVAINHYADAETLIERLSGLLNNRGHIYIDYDNSHEFDRIDGLFDFGSGRILSNSETGYGVKSHIEPAELFSLLERNGLIICNMHCDKPRDTTELKLNMERLTKNEDFILSTLARVAHSKYSFDVIKV